MLEIIKSTPEGDKVIIFSHFILFLYVLKNQLDKEKINSLVNL